MKLVSRVAQGLRLALGFLAIAFCMAPVPGDVGGCGEQALALDARKFFAAKANIDCDRCGECDFNTQRCAIACGSAVLPNEFPEGCVPLAHDGEVCLNALLDASCDEYGSYVRDMGPDVPSECNFCPLRTE